MAIFKLCPIWWKKKGKYHVLNLEGEETVEIDKELFINIMNFFLIELEDYVGARREDYEDGTTLAQIYDKLYDDFVVEQEDDDEEEDQQE